MKDLAHLAAGLVLALAGCVLVAIHNPVPSYIPFAALTLLGVSAGLALPSAGAALRVPPANTPADPSPVPVAQLGETADANPQVASAPVTPPVTVPVAPGPAQPPAAAV